MTLRDQIIDYLKSIETTWPERYPGVTIEYYDDVSHSIIYVTVRYDGLYNKRVFSVYDTSYNNMIFGCIKERIQEMREDVMRKGKENIKNILNRKYYGMQDILHINYSYGMWDILHINYSQCYRGIFDKKVMPKPKKIIFNDPATIILWTDGTKTVVKKNSKDKKFDPEKGIALCYMKKALGNEGNYNNVFREWIK